MAHGVFWAFLSLIFCFVVVVNATPDNKSLPFNYSATIFDDFGHRLDYGTIIGEKHILCSLSRLADFPSTPNRLTVKLGADQIVKRISLVIPDSDFKIGKDEHDFAVLKISDILKWSWGRNKSIAKVDLPTENKIVNGSRLYIDLSNAVNRIFFFALKFFSNKI